MEPERPRLALLLAALSLTACSRESDLPAIPHVVVDHFDSVVAEQVRVALQDAGSHRNDAEINGHLGMVLQAYNQQQAAADAYSIARLLDPGVYRWAYYHGIVLAALGRPDEAQKAYQDAIAIDSSFHGASLRLAQLLSDAGNKDAADKIYSGLLESHNDIAQIHFEYGQFLLRNAEPEKAITELQESLSLAGDFGLAHYSLMQANRRTGDRDATRRHQALFNQFESKKLEISDPYWAEIMALVISDQAYLDRARQLVARGRKEAAIVELRKAEELNPGNILVHSNLIALLGSVGQIEQASVHYERAIAIDPLYAQAYLSYTIVLNYARQYENALRILDDGIARVPGNVDLRLEKANVYLLAQQPDDARAAFLQALQIDAGNKQILMQLGRLELQQGNVDASIDFFSQAVEPEDDDSVIALRALSGISGLQGDLDTSRVYLERALIIARRREQQDLVAKIEQDIQRLDAAASTHQ